MARMEEAQALVAARQAEMDAAGYVAAVPATGEFTGNKFPAAMFKVNDPAIVTRSSGEESGCTIYEVLLTAFGPQYNVYLGQHPETGENIFKWADENDLREYPPADE